MRQFVASLGVKQVDWVGTSMGGLIGMFLQDLVPGCIRKMVLNDIGPYIPAESLQRISKYVGIVPEFVDLDSAERHMRKAYAPFGITHDADWQYFTKHSVQTLPNGKYTMAYDPAIAKSSFQTEANAPIPAFEAWDLWQRLSHHAMLVIHGETSDILLPETVATMQQLSATTDVRTVHGVGHAPALIVPKLIDDIASWLKKTDK
jgi:pimeloyl-ACP methyl ester carboxylesterase